MDFFADYKERVLNNKAMQKTLSYNNYEIKEGLLSV